MRLVTSPDIELMIFLKFKMFQTGLISIFTFNNHYHHHKKDRKKGKETRPHYGAVLWSVCVLNFQYSIYYYCSLNKVPFNIKMIKSAFRFLEFLIVCEVFVLFYSMKINSLKKGKINKALDGISKTIYFIGHFLWLFLLLII